MKQDLGCLMALVLVVGALCVAYALAPTATVLAGWTGAMALLWRGVRKTPDQDQETLPHYREEHPENTNVQVSYVQDKDNPQRWEVVRTTETRDET